MLLNGLAVGSLEKIQLDVNVIIIFTINYPRLYSFNGLTYKLILDLLVLGRQNEKTYFVEIPEEKIKEKNGECKFKIKGDENEITYLDKIYLKTTDIKGDNEIVNLLNPTKVSKDGLSLIAESDDNYLILNQGDELFLEFDAPESKQGYQRKIEFAVEGYYEKIQNSISQSKSLSEFLGLGNPFEEFLKYCK